MKPADHDILFIPGPVEVKAELRQIMAMPMIGHRSQRFLAEVIAVCQKLKPLYLTKSATTLFENCPATALMEFGIRNLVHERVLHLTCGAFSERWAKISTACGRKPEVLAVDWGQANTPQALRAKLLASPPFEAVCITHNETSTGLINPLRELAATVHECAPDTLILVDVVTSLAGAEVRFDDWGLDLAFAGTQKALALPPGLCTFAISERAMRKAATVPGRGFLLDFVAAQKDMAEGKTLATPCVPLVLALHAQLDRIAKEGLENRWRRHTEMQAVTAQWAREKGFEFLCAEPYRSPTVSAVKRGGRDLADMIAKGKAAGYTMSKGYGKLAADTFRIGHMGDHEMAHLRGLLAAIA